ncbi:LPXTG cell wall anchor domain-containing protein [Vibrio cholerae]|nr:LPXTG cell wall anchor domain-containing protein [Vibrio cholerae]
MGAPRDTTVAGSAGGTGAADGSVTFASAGTEVSASGTPDRTALADTGAGGQQILLAGSLLLLAGVGGLLVARRAKATA